MENDVTKQNNDEQQLIGDEQALEDVDPQGNGVDTVPEVDELETVRAERDRYLDQWQRRDGEWRIFRRVVVRDWGYES